MKKTILAALLGCLAFGFSACTFVTEREVVYESNFQTLDLRINAGDWQYSEEGNYYFYTFSVPSLSSEIYNHGTVNCYREYNKGTRDAYQLPLPQTIHNIELVNGQEVLYTTTIDYSFAVGMVEIVLTNNDFYYTAPKGMDFRLNMTW